jgi:hypothetical protein
LGIACGWIPVGGLTAHNPQTNHLAVYKDPYGNEVNAGPNSGPVYSDNQLRVINADGQQSIEATGEIAAPSLSFANPNPTLLTEAPSDYSLWLGPGDEPDASQRKLYLGDNPVDTTDGGIKANPPKTDYVMLFKDDQGDECYPGEGESTNATLDATVKVTGTVETPALLLDPQSSKPDSIITPLWVTDDTPMYEMIHWLLQRLRKQNMLQSSQIQMEARSTRDLVARQLQQSDRIS